MNRVVLTGRLVRSPEIRKTQTGTSVCDFTLAVRRKISQEGQPDADFIGCVAWNKTADIIYQYLNKGSQIGIEGRLQTSNYENRKGEKIYKTHVQVENIEFLEPKKSDGGYEQCSGINTYEQQKSPVNQPEQANTQGYSYAGSLTASAEAGTWADDALDIASDDLPF